jgi:hypothetical protein
MKKMILFSAAGAGFLLLSLAPTLAAQDRDHDAYSQDRDAYFHGEHWHTRLFDRVREDVQHVRASTWPSGGGDDYRLDRTMGELNELQGKFANHVYDETQLDDVIRALGRVASFNRMSPGDRDLLNDDIARLRDFRDHHEDWIHER